MNTVGIKKNMNRIVLVDDDEDLTRLIQYEFLQIGFETIVFNNGQEALNFIMNEENLADVFLLILDRILPDMDGLDILKQFKSQSNSKIPVLILSALNSKIDVLEGIQCGALDYITKPFSIFLLMQKTINLLKDTV